MPPNKREFTKNTVSNKYSILQELVYFSTSSERCTEVVCLKPYKGIEPFKTPIVKVSF